MKVTQLLRRPYHSLATRLEESLKPKLEEPYRYVAEAFTREKQFRPGSILRDPTLNKLGLHPLRMALSFGCRWERTRRSGPPTAKELADHAAFFRQNGYVAVHNFAGAERFEVIKKEVDAIVANESYYHHEQDGSTQIKRARLNRQSAPACDALLRDPRLTELVRLTSGFSVQRVDPPVQAQLFSRRA